MKYRTASHEIAAVQVYCPHCDSALDPEGNGYSTCHRDLFCPKPRTIVTCTECQKQFRFPTITGFNK